MNKIILLAAICFSAITLTAQQKTTAVTPASQIAAVKVVPIVSTKELKKQLERNYNRKKYKKVIPIADTLLKRNKKDQNAFMKKVASKIYLKMDKQAIADLKGWYKNKDTAGLMIAFMPYQFDFKSKNRSGDIYYKSAMALSPKSGIPHVLYAAQLADEGKTAEALNYGDKGYAMLSPGYKTIFANTYAMVLHGAERKEDAYKLMENEIKSGNNSEDNLRTYFRFYAKDKRYQDGIDKATEMIPGDSTDFVLSRRAILYNEMGNNEKACEDAMLLKERFSAFTYLVKQFNCPQVMADVQPAAQRTYIYEVIFQGQTYDFRVTNPIVDMSNGVSFKFKMTGDVGIGGLITISKDAIDTAHVQMNRFGNGNKELTEETSVWLSNAVFNELKTNGESFIQASIFSAQVFEVVAEDEPFYTVKVDDQDKYIKCIRIASKSGDDSQEIWINDDPKNPLILKMNLDFSIELKQIL